MTAFMTFARARLIRSGGTITIALLLAGCAHYVPDPLSAALAIESLPSGPIFVSDYPAGQRGAAASQLTIDLGAPLDDRAVASLAVMANPDLKAQRARAGVSDAQVFAAGLMPDPTMSLGVDHLLGGTDPVDALTGALGLDLNALRTRAAVRAKAEAERGQVRNDLLWAEWQTAGQARLQAVRIVALERHFALADQSQKAAASLLAHYTAAAGRGDIAADALQTARIAASGASDIARQAQKDLATARLELNRLLGLPPQTMLTIAPGAETEPLPESDRLFAIAQAGRADLRALREGYDAHWTCNGFAPVT